QRGIDRGLAPQRRARRGPRARPRRLVRTFRAARREGRTRLRHGAEGRRMSGAASATPDILRTILARKAGEVAERAARVPFAELEARCRDLPDPRGFAQALEA